MNDFERELAALAHDARLSAIYSAEQESIRPFVQLRPRMFIDGDQWCALYGENLQDGVTGFGDTPAIAAEQFDNAWINGKAPNVGGSGSTTVQVTHIQRRACRMVVERPQIVYIRAIPATPPPPVRKSFVPHRRAAKLRECVDKKKQ